MERDTACVEEIEMWAKSKVNCSHGLCSMAEGVFEEKFGKEVLDIIKKHQQCPKPKRAREPGKQRKPLSLQV